MTSPDETKLTYCSHMRVRYKTVEQGSGLVSGHWECDDCFTEFLPKDHTPTPNSEAVEKAMAATNGPWNVKGSDNATPHIMHDDCTDIDDLSKLVCHMPAEITLTYNSWNNAHFIAAANPSAVIELCDEVERLRELLRSCIAGMLYLGADETWVAIIEARKLLQADREIK